MMAKLTSIDSEKIFHTHTFRRKAVFVQSHLSSDLTNLMQTPNSYVDDSSSWLKKGNTASVVFVKIDTMGLVIKRYNIKNRRHRLKRLLTPTRAARSWSNALRLRKAGIPVANPVAMIEERYGPFRSRAFFIAEKVNGVDAFEYFTSTNPSAEKLHENARKLVDIILRMGQARFVQPDTKAENFVISPSGPVMVDLDAIRRYRLNVTFQKAFDKCWQPLLHSWRNHPDLYAMFETLIKERIHAAKE